MTQQGSKAFVTDLLHFTAVIGCEFFPRIRIGNRTIFPHFCCQSDIPAGSADAQLIAAAFDDPIVFQNTPNRKAAIVQRNSYLLFFARFQGNLGKTLQFLLRTEHTVGCGMDIQLRDFFAIDAAYVADSKMNRIFGDSKVGVFKFRMQSTIL